MLAVSLLGKYLNTVLSYRELGSWRWRLPLGVPRKLKDKVDRLDIDWDREIRWFIEEKVGAHGLLEVIDGIRARARGRRLSVDSSRLIREDRERR